MPYLDLSEVTTPTALLVTNLSMTMNAWSLKWMSKSWKFNRKTKVRFTSRKGLFVEV